MSQNKNDKKIEVFKLEKRCDVKFDTSQLALQDVKQINSHYSRKIIMLQDADIKVTWSLEDVKKYFWGFLTGEQKEIFSPTKARVVTHSLGLLFRYRMDWEPKGYGLGELLYSISLLPNEELTLEFKTWETSTTQKDEVSKVEEKNSSDIQSTQSDVKEVLDDYNSKENFEFSAHAEASCGWASASVDTKYSTEASEQHKTVTKAAKGGVQKSLNSLAQKRSIKVAISRETGSESKSTRKIKNINQCHTLNVNYYQLLRQYKVSMYLYDVQMVLFGNYHQTSGKQFSIGTILAFLLPEPPSREELIASLLDYSLDSNPYGFQNKILHHCTPRPDINNPDLLGKRRYAFMINPGPFKDKDNDGVLEYPIGLEELLDYLYGFYTKDSPPPEMAKISVVKEKLSLDEIETVRTEIVVPRFHFLQGVKTADFTKKIKSVKENVIEQFIEARKNLNPEQLIESWPMAIPTYGIYAETMLGKCSGCEDYFEIQRQFDLELKKLEVEKLNLEVEKLKILNQKTEQTPAGSTVTIKNPPEKSSVQLNVDITPGEEKTEVSFEKEET